MKKLTTLLLLQAGFYLLTGCNQTKTDTEPNMATEQKNAVPEGAVEGDFDGDGKTEFVWVEMPRILDHPAGEPIKDCEGGCVCSLKFSKDNMQSITLENCIGGTLVNEGDLNGDGTDEIGFMGNWFTSNWRSYHIYTRANDQWKALIEPLSVHIDDANNLQDVVQPDPSQSNRLMIQRRYSEDKISHVEILSD